MGACCGVDANELAAPWQGRGRCETNRPWRIHEMRRALECRTVTREKALRRCLARMALKKGVVEGRRRGGWRRIQWMATPMRRPAPHGQVEGCGAVAHPAAVLPGADLQTQVHSALDAPVVAAGLQERHRRQCGGRGGGVEVLGLDPFGRVPVTVHAAGEAGGLLDEGKVHRRGGGVEGDEAAGFGAAAIAFAGLHDRRRVPRGKRRATSSDEVVARCRPHPFGCL